MFGERVPDPAVGAGGREVIALFASARGFSRNYGGVNFVYFREEGSVAVKVLGNENSRAREKDVIPFVLKGREFGGRERRK
jgi:hypothetical protein